MDEQELTEVAKAQLRQQETELIKIIDALAALSQSKEWNVLKELVFDKSLASIENQLLNASLAQNVSAIDIYRLQGQRLWAKRYCDINGFIANLKKQLENIKNKLQ